MKKPKKQACDTLRGCLEYLEHHWLTPHGYSLGAVKGLGGGQHRAVVLDRHKREALVVTIQHAGPGDWDIAEAVSEIQKLTRGEIRRVASTAESVN